VPPRTGLPDAAPAALPPGADQGNASASHGSPAGYDILAELGRGGMGVVYQARQNGLERTVALKMILGGGHASGSDLARFRTEAEAIARLQHPHIVQIHEIGEHQGLPYFSLEFCGGGSLDSKLAGTPLPARDAAALLEKLALAVQAAHEKGVIHRDLKPANVLLTEDGTPKITDFGLAKKLITEPGASATGAGITQAGSVMGTPSYMAPEQAGGKSNEIGPACDIYALGAILYECLTGRPPFMAATALDTILQVVSEEPVPPTRLNRKVPRDLETICLKCLAKQPARRYGSAAALAEDLGRFQRGEPIRARPVGPVERLWRWGRRKPALAGMLAAVSLLGVAVVTGAFWYVQDRAGRERERLVAAARAEQKRVVAEQAIGQALDQAQAIRNELQKKLRQRGGVFELLNHPEDWQARIQMAQAGLDRARALLASAEEGLHQALKARIGRLERWLQQDEADRLLAVGLEKIRMDEAVMVKGSFNYEKAAHEYSRVFAAAGLAVEHGDRDGVVQRIRSMPIKEQVIAALDDWAWVAYGLENKQLPTQLMAVVRGAVPDPVWGDRLRRPHLWGNQQALITLANEAPGNGLSPQLLALLGDLLDKGHPLTQTWLRQAQFRFPGDFWLNFQLAGALGKSNPVEAAGFYRVALTLRPGCSAGYNNLGLALHDQNKLPDAIAVYQKGITLDPKLAPLYTNLGYALSAQGKLPEAMAAFRKAIALDPQDAMAHYNLGNALREQQQLPEAIASYRKAIAANPKFAWAHTNLGTVLRAQQQLPEAIASYQQAIAADPKCHEAFYGLGLALLEQGAFAEAGRSLQKALDLLPANDPSRPVAQDQLKQCQSLRELEKRLPGVLEGKQSARPAELLQMAFLCLHYQKRYASAVRLYREAFQGQPALMEDPARQQGYNAACAAALAGTGQGEDARRLPVDEQAKLRQQALTWLQADLAHFGRLLKAGSAQGRKLVVERLTLWHTDADLAGVREPRELAWLPEKERQDWVKLWAEVRRLLKATQGR
jgi:serine/threonine-protein kinase